MDKTHTDSWFIALFALLLLIGAVGACSMDAIQRRESDREWNARIQAANARKLEELESQFKSWKERVVLKDGTVEQWSGATSEVLLVESERLCAFHEDRYWVPCWTVWARTTDSRRYFTVVLRVDVTGDWRLKADDLHTEVDVQRLIDRALKLGKDDVLKRVGTVQVDA
jgi:hypothetical protein